jgi:hypothetical protein
LAISVGDFHQYKYEQNYNKDKNLKDFRDRGSGFVLVQ